MIQGMEFCRITVNILLVLMFMVFLDFKNSASVTDDERLKVLVM